MRKLSKAFSALIMACAVAAAAFLPAAAYAQTKGRADGVALLVNGSAVTNSDIAKRIAFLKLQHHSGNLPQVARRQLTDEALRRQEFRKRGISVSPADIDKAYAGFAASNRLSVEQLNRLMNQAGVTPDHFKSYIYNQMAWGRLVSARFQAESTVSPQEAVQRMLKDGGKKPSLNEYLLKQVILVVPANRRAASLSARLREANLMRGRVRGCDNIYAAAEGIKDVTVRTLGRFLEPQIPGEWAQAVRAAAVNTATRAQATKRGVEFLIVCSVQKVSDDRVAQLVFSMQDSRKSAERGMALEKKYMQELRSAAVIKAE